MPVPDEARYKLEASAARRKRKRLVLVETSIGPHDTELTYTVTCGHSRTVLATITGAEALDAIWKDSWYPSQDYKWPLPDTSEGASNDEGPQR